MSTPSSVERIRHIIDRVVQPILSSGDRRHLPKTPAEALPTRRGGGSRNPRDGFDEGPRADPSWIPARGVDRDEDRLMKTGRALYFALAGKRRIELPGSGLNLYVEGPFTLEFRAGDDRFPDALADAQWQKDLDELNGMAEGAPDSCSSPRYCPCRRSSSASRPLSTPSHGL